jgi:AraC family transcriptional regulator
VPEHVIRTNIRPNVYWTLFSAPGREYVKWSAPELAAVAALSEFHFARMFKQSTGESPHAYVLRRRIERAKCLIAAHRLPLSRIASACGFASQSHFSARFREIAGVTPKCYRAMSS